MATMTEALRGAVSTEILTKIQNVVDRFETAGDLISKSGTITSGVVPVTVRTAYLSVTGTQAYTLADGAREGQRLSVRCIVAASTPAGTLTPTTFTSGTGSGTGIAFDAVNDYVELEWHATGGWHVVAIVGAAIA